MKHRGPNPNPNLMEELNAIPASVYRVATKLESLQKLCHMDKVSVGHVAAAVHSVIGPQQLQDVELNREEVIQTLKRMFHRVGHLTLAAAEETCGLMFRLYDRTQTGRVSAASLQMALIALSADNLLDKYRALISVSENSSRSVSTTGFRSLLQDLSQIPAAVQGEMVFGTVEVAVLSCMNGLVTPMLNKEHVLSWLQSNPLLLLWLPALYRLSITQNIHHSVRCHTCKIFPITGLRYRCMKCVNIHLCQSCYMNDRQTRKHKLHHPVLEFCTQPTWRESLSSLVHSARYALLPRQQTHRNRRKVVMWVEPGEIQNSGPPPSDASTPLADSAVHNSPTLSSSSSKALQKDEETLTQHTDTLALMNEVKNLHRDKWQLEQELQAWRLAVQSEHGLLEDRCSEMEITMETLRQHHLCLQEMLTLALNKTEVHQHTDNGEGTQQDADNGEGTQQDADNGEGTQQDADNGEGTQQDANNGEGTQQDADNGEGTQQDTDNTDINTDRTTTPTSDILRIENEEDQLLTPSSTIQWDTLLSHDLHWEEEEEFTGDKCLCHPTGQEDESKELKGEDNCMYDEEENCGICSPEKVLQETVDGMRAVMDTSKSRERQTGERERAELLEAAEQVGDSIHHLVDAVRTNIL